MTRRRVAFIYIAQPHQVLHSISVAVELARLRDDLEVELLVTSTATFDYATDLVARLGGAPLQARLLGPAWLRSQGHDALPAPKIPMLAANLRLLSGFDVIVTPERTTAILRRMGLRRQKLVYTQHGAGDRGGAFEPRLQNFDLVFAAGVKQRDRMIADRLVAPDACAVVGYPKFDVVSNLQLPAPRLFARTRPTVLYNPHFDRRLSSWPLWGVQILKAFAESDRYNLIFAPHIRLFEKSTCADLADLAPFRGLPGIHIDVGGPSAFDMTYTQMADIYLGDVSSQVYEFIRTPRPCLFLNAHGVDWSDDDSYRHWRLGPVLDSPLAVIAGLEKARERHPDYHPTQVENFLYSFDLQTTSSSLRAARAIAAVADAA